MILSRQPSSNGKLEIQVESSIWYFDGTFKSASQVLHAELTSTTGRSVSLPLHLHLPSTHKDTPIYIESLQALADNCLLLLPQVINDNG